MHMLNVFSHMYSKNILNDFTKYFVIGLIGIKLDTTLSFRASLNLIHLLN